MPPSFLILLSASSCDIMSLPFSSVVNSRKSSSGVMRLRVSSSVPNSLGMGKKGMMGEWSME